MQISDEHFKCCILQLMQVSDEGRGVAGISKMLTLTRLHNSMSAASSMRRYWCCVMDHFVGASFSLFPSFSSFNFSPSIFFTGFLCLPLLLYSLHFGARIKAFWSFKTVKLIICYLFCLSEWWTLPGTTALGARPLAQCSKTIHSTSRPWPVWR